MAAAPAVAATLSSHKQIAKPDETQQMLLSLLEEAILINKDVLCVRDLLMSWNEATKHVLPNSRQTLLQAAWHTRHPEMLATILNCGAETESQHIHPMLDTFVVCDDGTQIKNTLQNSRTLQDDTETIDFLMRVAGFMPAKQNTLLVLKEARRQPILKALADINRPLLSSRFPFSSSSSSSSSSNGDGYEAEKDVDEEASLEVETDEEGKQTTKRMGSSRHLRMQFMDAAKVGNELDMQNIVTQLSEITLKALLKIQIKTQVRQVNVQDILISRYRLVILILMAELESRLVFPIYYQWLHSVIMKLLVSYNALDLFRLMVTLLNGKFNANYCPSNSAPLLHYAVLMEHPRMAVALVRDYGALVDALAQFDHENEDRNTALSQCIVCKQTEMVQLLVVQLGATVTSKDVALAMSEMPNQVEIIQLLLAYKNRKESVSDMPTPELERETAIPLVVDKFNWDVSLPALSAALSVVPSEATNNTNANTLQNQTMLVESDEKFAEWILTDNFIPLDQLDGYEQVLINALCRVCSTTRIDAIRLLLTKCGKININSYNSNGATPLLLAACHSKTSTQICKMLIEEFDANVLQVNRKSKLSLLMAVAGSGNLVLLEWLWNHKPEIRQTRDWTEVTGANALHYACSMHNKTIDCARFLLVEAHCDPTIVSIQNKDSILHFVTRLGHPEMLRQMYPLLSHVFGFLPSFSSCSSSVSCSSSSSSSVSSCSTSSLVLPMKLKTIAQELANLGNRADLTPLHSACGAKPETALECVRILIELYQADVNYVRPDGHTALSIAYAGEAFDIVAVLVSEYGANLSLACNKLPEMRNNVL